MPHLAVAVFLLSFVFRSSQLTVDVSTCNGTLATPNQLFLNSSEPLILEQSTPLPNSTLNCRYSVSIPSYTRPTAIYQGQLGTNLDSIEVYQQIKFVSFIYIITIDDENVTLLLHPFDFLIHINLSSNKTVQLFTLTFTATSVWQDPEDVALDEDSGTILDSNELQPQSARRYSCGSVPNCVPHIHGTPLQDDLYMTVQNQTAQTFLDSYYVFADDVYVFNLRSGYLYFENQIGWAFENSTTLVIIHDQDIDIDGYNPNIILLFSSSEKAFPPDYTGAVKTSLSVVIDIGNINLDGGNGTIFHLVLPPDHNPFLTSFIIEFAPLDKHTHFTLLNVYANCASQHNNKSLLASVTEVTAEKWKYLMLRGRCRTFFLRGKVQLQLAAQYQSTYTEVSSVRNGVLISDDYLSQNNVLVNDSMSLTFTNGSTGTVSMYWTPTGNQDQVSVSVDGRSQTLEGNLALTRSGKHFLINYQLGKATKGAIVHFQAEFNGSYTNVYLFLFYVAFFLRYEHNS